MDTIGSLVDKLITVDMKMWYAQEDFYKIREMTYKEFAEMYYNDIGMKVLYRQFQKAIDLNIQRNDIIDEIDTTFVDAVQSINDPSDYRSRKYIQKKHKTY